MKEEKKNNGVIALLVVVIVVLLALIILFATGTITLGSNKQTNEDNQISTDDNSTVDIIQTKLVDNLVCAESETTFNGVTVKLVQSDNDGVCTASSLLINGEEIKDDVALWVNSYEFYDNNVIIHSANTSGPLLTIYSVVNNSAVMKLDPNSLDGYWAKSYMSDNYVIVVNGEECGEQCGIESTGYKFATFEIAYSNGSFATPNIVSQTN